MLQGECSNYVVNVHPILAMEVCATRKCSSYVVNVHPVLAMEVCVTGGNVRVM